MMITSKNARVGEAVLQEGQPVYYLCIGSYVTALVFVIIYLIAR